MWDIVGHERAVAALRREVEAGTLPHALLLTGPAGIGKTRLALELAKALTCTGEEPPCQSCVQCRQIESGSHPDVSVIERAEGKEGILIDQVRALRESAALRPFQARAKVFIVAGAEMLTLPAADALLKTLEEPQAAVTIVLAATEADALPATVLSRCRLLSLQPVGQSAVAEALIERGTDAEEAERLARLARGSVGWALAAARTPKLAVEREELLERLSAVLELDLEARLLLAEDLAANRKDRSVVRRSLELLLLLARDLLLLSQGLSPRLVDGAARERLARQAARLSLSQIDAYLASIRTAMERIDRNVDPRLSLEALLTGAP